MTRDELIDLMAEEATPPDIARIVTHDAFDSFVEACAALTFEDGLSTLDSWHWFHTGWDAR